MISRRTKAFKRLLAELPAGIQKQAQVTYRLWSRDSRHPGLHFKKVHTIRPIWSARVTQDHRALGIIEGDTIIWFWIGSHDEYERLLKRL